LDAEGNRDVIRQCEGQRHQGQLHRFLPQNNHKRDTRASIAGCSMRPAMFPEFQMITILHPCNIDLQIQLTWSKVACNETVV
jgi:hypothetical protein